MKKSLMLFIASILVLPGFVLGGDVVINNISNMTNQCNAAESKTYWYYLTNSESHDMYDNFLNTSADSYITVQNNSFTGSSVEIWRNNGVISNCNDWNRTSTAVRKNNTAMAIKNQDGCTFNIPLYTKVSNPNGVDAQVHYTIGFVQFNYGLNTLTDKLYYTTYGNNLFTCFSNGNQVSDGSSCPSSNIMYSKEYFHKGECMNYKLFWCGDGLVNSATGTTYNNIEYTEQCDPNDPTHSGWNNNGKICNDSCQLVDTTPTTCTIDIDPDSLVLGNTGVVSYTISGEFNSPVYLEMLPNTENVVGFPLAIYGGTDITTGSVPVGTNFSTGTYTFYIFGGGLNGEDFICTGILNVVEPQLDIEKEIDFISGDTIQYTITLTNNNKVVYHNAYIRDKMPQAVSYQTSTIIGVSNYNFGTWTSGGREWFEYSGFDMQPGDVVYVILTGTIAMTNASISNQISNSPLFMMSRGVEQIANTYYESYKSNVINCAYTEGDEDCAEYPEDEFMSGSLNKLVNGVKTDDVEIGDTVTYTIDFQNLGNVDWTSYSFVDILPSEVDFQSLSCDGCSWSTGVTTAGEDVVTIVYDSILAPQATGMFTIIGTVNSIISSSKLAVNVVNLQYTTKLGSDDLSSYATITYDAGTQGGSCGNGILEYGEECDGGYDNRATADVTGRFYIFDYLDFEHTTLAGVYEGKGYYCTEDCRLSSTQGDVYDVPSCLNVDTTISVMENEIMPFWWRIWQKDKMKFVNGGNSVSCNPNQNGKTVINKDTMKCTFKIYNGHSYSQKNGEPINEIELDCFDDINGKLDKFFSPFDDNTCQPTWCVDFSKVASRRVFTIESLLNLSPKESPDAYGEYKISLTNVDYEYCSSDGTWKKGNMCGGAICEVNFVFTTPYIMQTNTAGVPTATTSNFLNKFYDIAGNKIVTDISDIMKVSTSNYSETANVESEINKFKNKYESLAVKSNVSWGDGIDTVKKVPGKNIYFVSGNGKLVLSASTLGTNPFTVVVTGMDVVISGSVSTNGMIITNKTMSFKDESCLTGGQVVKGIFIAEGGFVKNGTTLNININKPRCHWGNLNVKGVLIGKNIKNLTESKRSQLNSRFDTELRYRNTNDSKLKAERRNEIFQGASLLIEYNPDLWSNTIPGAEIFTETLSVYKK